MTNKIIVIVPITILIIGCVIYMKHEEKRRVESCVDQVIEVMKYGPTAVRTNGPSAGVLVMAKNVCSN